MTNYISPTRYRIKPCVSCKQYNKSIEGDLLSLPDLIHSYYAYENTNMFPLDESPHLSEEAYVIVIDCIKRINKKLEESK